MRPEGSTLGRRRHHRAWSAAMLLIAIAGTPAIGDDGNIPIGRANGATRRRDAAAIRGTRASPWGSRSRRR